LGTYALWLGEWEDVFAYPILVVICAITAFFFTDQWRRIELSSWVSNTLGVIILAKVFADLLSNTQEALTALAHFLCYLQVAKWFREKRAFDFGLIYVMNLLQLAIGAILAKQSSFGMILAIYFFVAIWCGLLFFLCRHHDVIRAPGPVSTVIDFSFLGLLAKRTAVIWCLGLPMALTIFWLLPRSPRNIDVSSISSVNQRWTGFSSVVALDNETNIFENGEIAFTLVSIKDGRDQEIELPPDILWRGNVLTIYSKGRWERSVRDTEIEKERLPLPLQPVPDYWYVEIERVASVGNHLFAPAGLVGAESRRPNPRVRYVRSEERILLDLNDEEIANRGGTRVNYSIVVDPNRFQTGLIGVATQPSYLEMTKRVPNPLRRTEELARQLVEDVPNDDVQQKISRVFDYLTTSGNYQYSLIIPTVDKSLDPIEDFLFVRKTGHCEYFASSLALLLRSAGVSTRLVTGYKGLDVNRAGGYFQVRQLFSHAWVEAYLPDKKQWITLDPTPGEARANMVERKQTWFQILTDVRDVAIRTWGYYIVNFSVDDQRRALMSLSDGLVQRIGLPMVRLQEYLSRAWQESAWLVVIVGLTALAGVVAFLWIIVSAMLRLYRWWRPTSARAVRERVDAYENWLRFLRAHGLKQSLSQTPLEFAEAVRGRLDEIEATRPWSRLALDFSNSWYAYRFGDETISGEHWQRLAGQADQLARCMADARIRRLHAASPT
jgi:transglutaminase-like putative cysteine protease